MYAVVVRVSIQGEAPQAQDDLRNQVIPRVSAAPGFVRGFWTAPTEGSEGLSFVVWETRDNADNAARMVRESPPPQGVTITGVEIREIIAEA